MDISKVIRVYSGKRGCMCGCRGKYTANPAYREQESKELGYPLEDNECSERSVKIIAGKVLRNPNAKRENNCVFVEENGRILAVYFADDTISA